MSAGPCGAQWLLARRQTAGYGRRGTDWRHADGNFAATFLTPFDGHKSTASQISFVTALAVRDAAKQFAPDILITLKWPNDVLADGRKTAGILPELIDGVGGVTHVCLGIGVNLAEAPTGVGYETGAIADYVCPPTPSEFLHALDAALFHWRRRWATEGFGPIRESWTHNAAGLGRAVSLSGPHETVKGVLEGIDEAGALVLKTPGGAKKFVAGSLILEGK